MQEGLHVAEKQAFSTLSARGLVLPGRMLGVLDVCRMIEGQLPEPPPRQPLGIVGLEALLLADVKQARTVLLPVRRALLEGKRYFHWKQIPLVFVVDGTLEGTPGLTGLQLRLGEQTIGLSFLLGSQLKPTLPDSKAWWWSPQVG